jgi:hypothetical protein
MSPEAIDQRLRDVSQLYKLWMSLREARDLGRAEDFGAGRFKLVPDASGGPDAAARDKAEEGR